MLIRSIIIFIFSLVSTGAFSQSYSGPESVEYDFANSRWLIANTQSHQVLARDAAGVLTVFATLTGSGPYGIEIVGDTLFCCNGGSIKGFLLSDGSQVFNVNVGASFLNGITHDDAGNLVATDFSAKAIFKINIAAQTFSAIATGMTTTPNGIIFDAANNRCVFVNWGSNAPVKAIDLATNSITTLTTTTLGNCDGIARDGQGNYYVSCWSGQKVVRFDSSFSSAPVDVVTGLSNPADIFYNTVIDTLGVPNAGNNSVTFHGFGTTGITVNKKTEVRFIHEPFTGIITLEGHEDESFFRIYELNGREITSGKISLSESIIRLDELDNGIYILSLTGRSGTSVFRFVR